MRGSARRQVVLLCFVLIATSGCKGAHATASISDAGPSDGAGALGEASASASVPAWADAAPADDTIPATSSDELTARARHLLEAITKDDADLATDIVFPRAAWFGLKDVADPAREWDKKVDRPFRRALHALSRHAEGAQFVSLELGRAVVQETVKRHGWKKALWSVHGSRLTYVVDGHTRTLSIREMTAWRGAWYITRLR
jgi:hypothetical protein